MTFDFCIIGGGIIGLATALDLLERRPGASLALIEKESTVAAHQTGHNSGVIHSGIYYAPGSLKARLCLEGCAATKDYSRRHGIAEIVPQGRVVRFAPVSLPESKQLRLQRLYPGSTVKSAVDQILVPKPDGDYLGWATTLLTQLYA